jgi:hypothetical protein
MPDAAATPAKSVETSQPFESLESAHEFMTLLEQCIGDAIGELQGHREEAASGNDERRTDAVNLAIYKLNQLATHTHKSRRLLNDLRTLRRLLFAERGEGGEETGAAEDAEQMETPRRG